MRPPPPVAMGSLCKSSSDLKQGLGSWADGVVLRAAQVAGPCYCFFQGLLGRIRGLRSSSLRLFSSLVEVISSSPLSSKP